MKIALAQLTSVDDIAYNYSRIEQMVDEASRAGARLIIFPENSLYMRIKEGESLPEISWETNEIQQLKQLAWAKNINIHVTLPFLEPKRKKLINASILFSSDSLIEPKITYRKVHLFDIELEGQRPVRESDVFEPGEQASVFSIDQFNFGSSICYDLRFAELYGVYGKQAVDAIVVPAAFLVQTGIAHWEVLLRARAIESQCYVLAAAQAGRHESRFHQGMTRDTFGHTMVVGPWGNIIAEKKSEAGLIYSELEKDELSRIRRQIPMKSHRRL